VSEVVSPDRLWARAHEIAATIAAKPPSATQGTVKANLGVAGQALPCGTGAEPDLHEAWESARPGRLAARGNGDAAKPRSADARSPALQAPRRRAGLQPDAAAIEYDGNGRRGARSPARPGHQTLVVGQHQVGILLRNKPAHVASFLGVLLAGGVSSSSTRPAYDRTRADVEGAGPSFIVGERDDLASAGYRRPDVVSISSLPMSRR